MFSVGEKIVYPMFGAGTIEEIENKNIEGKNESYYVIDIPSNRLKIRVSTRNAEVLGLRRIMEASKVKDAMEKVAIKPVKAPDNWNQRYKENMEKIKTGRFIEVAEVVRALNIREKERGLSGAEKKMLNNARQIIISEIIYSKDMAKDKAEEFLSTALLNY